MNFLDIDWQAWQPNMRATLLFVLRNREALLIRKKRGLGAGKINAPGGRIEPGETPLDCARREVEEELLTTPMGIAEAGLLRFQFADGLALQVHVFTAADCDRTPGETDEAIPLWVPTRRIPYAEMWADDRVWLPFLLRQCPFDGRFLFDGDRMLGYEMTAP